MKKRIIVGISGASGVLYGLRLLEVLKEKGSIEIFLTISQTGNCNRLP
jgi:4-hydroxy-3-polyprenylbenzoate decarboxylase